MGYVTKIFSTFDAAHQLPHHDGKCSNLHGHTYRVEVDVSGPIYEANNDPKQGMIVDFSVLGQIYDVKIKAICDHALLLGTITLPWIGKMLPEAANRELTGADALLLEQMGINKVALLPIPVTTAEYMAGWMFGQLYDGLRAVVKNKAVAVQAVRVYETPTSYATALERYAPQTYPAEVHDDHA